MSTDKAVFHAEFLDCFVDRSFDASCVCNDTSFLDDILEISEIFNIILYRSAEKNIITHGITVIPFFQCGVNSTAVQCGSQSFFVFRICENVIIRDEITDIQVTSAPGEDSAYLSQGEGVISSILSAQSTDVDTISGATFSSTGIINAVVDALGKAEN